MGHALVLLRGIGDVLLECGVGKGDVTTPCEVCLVSQLHVLFILLCWPFLGSSLFYVQIFDLSLGYPVE